MKTRRLGMAVLLLVAIGKTATAQGADTLSRTDIVPVTAGHQSYTWLKGTQPPLRWVAEEFPNFTHQSVVPALR